jgi:serine/threonine protein kinase/tetratricopeptide (TPR) repeat protein
VIPDRILHYNIEKKLGEGGMGEVFLATDTKLDRKVALKSLPPHYTKDPEFKERFQHEAKAAAALNHSTIVTIYDLLEHEGRLFIAMEYIEGDSLENLIKDDGVSLKQAIQITQQILEGLNQAHQAGIVHRDIKPSNVVVTTDGRAKILDFGLAKSRKATTHTKTGTTLGTLQYESPEQVAGEQVDHRSDLFSVGSVLYEMVTGRTPFAGEFEDAIRYSILNEEPEPLARYKSGVSQDLQRMVSKALEKDVALRYQHADGMLADIKRLGIESSSKPAKSPVGLWIAAAIVIVVATYLGYTRLISDDSTSHREKRKMLAVLPFENLGSNEDEYFADGLTEEITSRLAQLSGLGVISRTSAVKYKNSDLSLKEIGRELGVDYILEGSIRYDKSSDVEHARINPQLIRVHDDTHLWTKVYDHELSRIFDVQTEIAEKVAEALDITLMEAEHRAMETRLTESVEAFQYYLRGNHFYRNFHLRDNIFLAIEMFDKAIAADPNMVAAYARKSNAHSWLYFSGIEAKEEQLDLAKAAVDRALEINPESAIAHKYLGFYYYRAFRDYDRALQALARSEELDPTGARDQLAGFIWRRRGDFEDAANLFAELIELNPRSEELGWELATTLTCMRRYEDALQYFDHAISVYPSFNAVYFEKAYFFWLRDGDLIRARHTLEEVPQKSDPYYHYMYFRQLTLERNFELAARFVEEQVHAPIALQERYYPASLLSGLALRSLERTEQAAHALELARIHLNEELTRSPDDTRMQSALAIAQAGLGNSMAAVQHASAAVDALPISKDALLGPERVEDLAWVYTIVGESDKAIEQLEVLLDHPARISVAMLEIDPRWDPLRDHPRFQALLEKGHKVF